MNILHDYAISIGESPKELEDDYFSSPEDEQLALMSHIMQYMQTGGPMQQQGQGDDMVMQIIQMFAEATQQDPKTIMQQLQQMSPEEQGQAIEQMTASLEQSQMQTGGYDDVSMLGYSDSSPYKYNASNLIQSNQISMDNTGVDLMGISDTGDTQYMPAYSGEYEFDGNKVMEYPVYQTGPDINELKKQLDSLKNSKKKFKSGRDETIFNDVLKEKELTFNRIKDLYNKANNTKFQNEANNYLKQVENQLNYFDTISVENYKTISLGNPYSPGATSFIFENNNKSKNKPSLTTPATASEKQDYSITYGGVTEPIKQVKPGVFQNSKGSTWVRGEDGKFVFQSNTANTPKAIKTETASPAFNNSSNTNKGRSVSRTSPYFPVTSDKNQWTGQWEQFLSGKGLIDGDKTYSVDEIDELVYDYVKKNPNEFEGNTYLKDKNLSTLLTDGKYGKVHESFLPPASRTNFGNVAPITPRGLSLSDIKLDTRFEKEGVKPAGIQYSPKIDGITPNRPPAKSMYKFNTSSVLGDAINNYKVSKAFEPIDLPYFEDVDYRIPEVQLYDPRPGLQAISDSFSPYENAINSGGTTGQAVLSSLAAKKADAMQKHSNYVQQQNMQIQNQRETMVADLYNKINAGRQSARTKYVDDLYRTEANRDAIIDTTLANVQQQNYNKGLEQNAYKRMLAFNPYLEDESGIVGNLLGKRKFSFDKEKARQANFGSTTTTINKKDQLLEMQKQLNELIAQMPQDETYT